MNGNQGKKPIDPKFWEALTEQRIREAQEAGEFDRLPGFGQPLPGIDEPHDENWWVKKKARTRAAFRPAAGAGD